MNIQIRVDEETNERRTIDAEIIGEMAVHRQLIQLWDGHEMFHPNDRYVVTHVRSGLALRYGQPYDTAVELATKLNELTTKWSDVTGESTAQTIAALGQQVYNSARAITSLYPEEADDE